VKQPFWKSIPFWGVVVTSIVPVAVRIASGADTAEIITLIGVALLAILGAANNPTNPVGFGANK